MALNELINNINKDEMLKFVNVFKNHTHVKKVGHTSEFIFSID